MNITEFVELRHMINDMEQIQDTLTVMWEAANTADQNGKKLDPHTFKTQLMGIACKAGKSAGTARRLADGETIAPLLKTRHIPVLGVVK